jgi:hypothetical protein
MFRFDRSRNLNQLGDLDRLIAENSERILDQRHVLSRLSDHSQQSLSANSWKIFSQRNYYISKLENNCWSRYATRPKLYARRGRACWAGLELYRRRGPPILTGGNNDPHQNDG